MTIITTNQSIRTSDDMIPVTKWLEEHVGPANLFWRWKVSDDWVKGWGHPMLVEFDDESDAVLFSLTWS